MKNNKNFYDWCVESNRQDLLDRWDYELNKCTPKEVSYASGKKYYFKCPRKLHKSELKRIANFTRGQEGIMFCSACHSFAQYLIDQYGTNALNLYWSDKNIINPWKIASQSHKHVWIKCQEKNYHHDYQIYCSNFYKGRRCPECNHNSGKIHKYDSLGYIYSRVLGIWSDKNKKSPYEYSCDSMQYVWWKCENNKHEDYYRSINSSKKCNFHCPECVRERDESFLQEKIRIYIESLDFIINHECNCSLIPHNPKSNKVMPFDNELIIGDKHLIIETNGTGHYYIDGYTKKEAKREHITPEQQLHKRKLYDRYKKYIAFRNSYFYLAIPYWTDNKEKTYKNLIDNKIKEIISISK